MATYNRVITASSYVLVNGLFVFQVGPTKAGDRLGVVRLGGHREAGETSLDCACREVLEEASLHITPLRPPATYLAGGSEGETSLQPITWPSAADEIAPLVVYRQPAGEACSVTYLSTSNDVPVPAAESHGLLLLAPRDLRNLTSRQMTLAEYLETGGLAVLRRSLRRDLPLEPYSQLRLLPRLLALHPDLIATS